MKIVHLSDTHGHHVTPFFEKQLRDIDADVVVHSGDFTYRSWGDAKRFLKWFASLDFKHKIVIPGNHDQFIERLSKDNYARKALIPTELHLLIDEEVVIEGVKFYGSPFTPAFNDWAFQLYGDEGKEHWAKIPDDTDVLITHGPAKGVLDTISQIENEPLGCPFLTERLTMLPQLKAHLFGHIHGGYGRKEVNGVLYLNSAILNESYQVVNKPQVFEI
jgi:Icc-related predicted phosphoesterase